MKLQKRYATIALLASTAAVAGAQQRPPIRQLGATVGKSAETFVNVTSVRPLSNGSLLVNDVGGRRLVLFTPQLTSYTLIADSTSATSNAYGARLGGLAGYKGDSSIFVDPASLSMLVIDPSGKVARVISVPRAQDANMLASPIGSPVLAPNGKLVYRAQPQLGTRTITAGPGGPNGGPGAFLPPEIPDSAPVLRIDLATRVVDTLGFIKTPKIKLDMTRDDNGGIRMSSQINPLPTVDDWAMTPDGAVAFVRGSDYHVDWINPDGTKNSTPKIPFDWQRMTEEDKAAFIDSLKAARDKQATSAPTAVIPGGAGPAPSGGASPNIQIFAGPGGPGGGPPRGGTPQFQQNFIPASELPDYKPAFFSGSTRADTEGNLWVRTIPTTAVAGGPVYDVISRKGQLVDRVQIPAGRTIIGFGPADAVYLVNREGATVTIERASVK